MCNVRAEWKIITFLGGESLLETCYTVMVVGENGLVLGYTKRRPVYGIEKKNTHRYYCVVVVSIFGRSNDSRVLRKTLFNNGPGVLIRRHTCDVVRVVSIA